jgi:hypothetical protein
MPVHHDAPAIPGVSQIVPWKDLTRILAPRILNASPLLSVVRCRTRFSMTDDGLKVEVEPVLTPST